MYNLLIMRFDESVPESLLGDFCLKMVESTAISGQIFLILMLDRSSQRRKMHLMQANPMQSIAKPSKLFLQVTAVLR